ncbi:hypothetical protein HU200_004323 [Digitaria exilis]|uniref:Glycolipid transfer protein domain-containing protein n=1 Tax=Digitaria exilis TaxID=1010633 RepID=A0A835KV59_9POAL|nr:hypothetical protein HU200_004323 [Digitaria exilis]
MQKYRWRGLFHSLSRGDEVCQVRQRRDPDQAVLEVCKHILPVLEKFGSAMSIVKTDIGGNITVREIHSTSEFMTDTSCCFSVQRLETKYASDPTKYEQLHSMVKLEVSAKTAKSSSSCTNGLLWLTRAMDFLVALFHNLVQHRDCKCSQVCSDAYRQTLKKWHGLAGEFKLFGIISKLRIKHFTVLPEMPALSRQFQVAISLHQTGRNSWRSSVVQATSTKTLRSSAQLSPLWLAENHKFPGKFIQITASVGMDDL